MIVSQPIRYKYFGYLADIAWKYASSTHLVLFETTFDCKFVTTSLTGIKHYDLFNFST